MPAEFHVFPCLSDNIGVLMRDKETGACAAIDAPEAEPILAALEKTGWTLTDILVTHKHPDHVAGVAELKERFGARVVAPVREAEFVPEADLFVGQGDTVMVGSLAGDVLFTPGHTAGHISYYFAGARALFAGDTMFALGCGRLLEGSPEDMWRSLQKLSALPDDTLLFCGHEYTLSNARFALAVDPDNAALKLRAAVVEGQRADGQLTVPSLLKDEKTTNPFLRADQPALAASVNLDAADPIAVFGALREWKNNF